MSTIYPKTFNIDGQEIESRFEQDVQLDRLNLNEEFETHSQQYGFYSTAYEICLDRERRLKAKLAQAYAHLDVQARANMKANGIRVSEKKVENMVITSEDYVALQEEYFDAQKTTGLVKAAKEAMIHKKECMISLGANLRQEMSSDPALLKEAYRKNHQG